MADFNPPSVQKVGDDPQQQSSGSAGNSASRLSPIRSSKSQSSTPGADSQQDGDSNGFNTPSQQNSWRNKPAFGAGAPAGGGFNNGWGNDFGGAGWGGDPWGDPWGGGGGAPGPSSNRNKRLTPQERVKMIEDLYQAVLARKPDTRDINYYKYSTLSEDEIRRQLMDGKEHKQLMEEGREYKKMKDRAERAETRIKMLEGQIRDQVEEFKNLTNLLNEKNRYIQQLRSEKLPPYQTLPKQAIENTHSFSSIVQPIEGVQQSAGSTQPIFNSGNTKEKKVLPISEQILNKIRSVISV